MADPVSMTHGMSAEKRAQFLLAVDRLQEKISAGHIEHPSVRQERKRALRAQFQSQVAAPEVPVQGPQPPEHMLPQWQVRSQ